MRIAGYKDIKCLAVAVVAIVGCFLSVFAVHALEPVPLGDKPLAPISSPVPLAQPVDSVSIAAGDSVQALGQDSVPVIIADSLGSVALLDSVEVKEETRRWRPAHFNPDPMRAVWLSALCPGLGQIYNRRYWKLPIVVGGYVGLLYATTWNNTMLSDYQRSYLDIMDSDPSTNSYMNLFSPAYREEDIDKEWLTRVLKQRKDFYRRNRDMCIIGMIGLYAVCMIDAYVDAQLYHFDISPDVSMEWKPAVIPTGYTTMPSVGVQCAVTF